MSQQLWIPRAGGHKAWLKALCTALLDSEGVRSEALLLSRPLCLVSTQTSAEERGSLRLKYLRVGVFVPRFRVVALAVPYFLHASPGARGLLPEAAAAHHPLHPPGRQ